MKKMEQEEIGASTSDVVEEDVLGDSFPFATQEWNGEADSLRKMLVGVERVYEDRDLTAGRVPPAIMVLRSQSLCTYALLGRPCTKFYFRPHVPCL